MLTSQRGGEINKPDYRGRPGGQGQMAGGRILHFLTFTALGAQLR